MIIYIFISIGASGLEAVLRWGFLLGRRIGGMRSEEKEAEKKG